VEPWWVRQVGEAVRLDDIVTGTPATRDRVVDFLRAASIVAVVFGHWMIGIVWWQDGCCERRARSA
jgi:hypothetical protein